MMYLAMPYGSNFGWGVLGKEIALALTQLTDVRVLPPPKADQRLEDEFEVYQFRRLLAKVEEHGRRTQDGWELDGRVIQAGVGRGLDPFVPGLAAPADVGYLVFEENVLPKETIANARRHYRRIAAASEFCAEVLRQGGLDNVSVVPHGVDTQLFSPRTEPRTFLADKFIVFSGGKFELRKGQDIVIRAYKVLQDRHKDVMLVNSWHNSWPKTRDTMANSTLIRYTPPKSREAQDQVTWVGRLLAGHGIDVERVITTMPRDHRLLAGLYHATDVGIFPNRCEGGNNMVLMEYLACGKPALASFNSGHKDILRRRNAVLIENHKAMEIREGKELVAIWSDPSMEETIEKLEWCYRHRDKLQALGRQAALDMRQFSWRRTAEGLI